MRRKLFTENVESTVHILRPFMDDVKVLVRFNEPSRRSAQCRTHVCDEEATIGFSTNLIRNGGKNCTIALFELGAIGVRGVKIEARVLFKGRLEIYPQRNVTI